MPGLKRTVTLEPGDVPLNKKIKRMERAIYRNRPEMRTSTFSFSGNVAASTGLNLLQPCRIASGTSTE